MLERARHFTQALIRKFRTYYNDYFTRMQEYLGDPAGRSQAYKLQFNYKSIMKMGTNLGCLCDYIEVQYGQIWNAVRKARDGFELP